MDKIKSYFLFFFIITSWKHKGLQMPYSVDFRIEQPLSINYTSSFSKCDAFPNCLHLNFSTSKLFLYYEFPFFLHHCLFTAFLHLSKDIFHKCSFISSPLILDDKSFLNDVIIKHISCFRNKIIIITPYSRKRVMQEACSYLN